MAAHDMQDLHEGASEKSADAKREGDISQDAIRCAKEEAVPSDRCKTFLPRSASRLWARGQASRKYFITSVYLKEPGNQLLEAATGIEKTAVWRMTEGEKPTRIVRIS